MKWLLTLICAITLAFAPGCKKDEPNAEGTEEGAEEAEEGAEEGAEEADEGEPVEPVEVDPAGTRFDPPVEKAAIPAGSRFCDMGTVHFAAGPDFEGDCPICHMHLAEKE